MKYRKQTACLGIALVALVACGGKPDGARSLKSIQSLERRLAQIAGQANQAAPAEVDPNTRLDSAKAGPGLKLTITYTLVNAAVEGVDATTFDARLTPTITTGSCKNPDLRPLIDQGVVLALDYRGSDGSPIKTLSINKATCAAIH